MSAGAAVPLSLPSDAENLSKSLCILRDQIEVFAATSDDVAARKRFSPKLGAVGLRCRHCYHLPLSSRAKGSVSYPKSISLIHQTIRNFHRFHFYQCEFIPKADKEAMKAIGKNKRPSKKGSDIYWIQSSKEQLGMVDENDGSGGSCIRFSENSPFHALADEHERSDIGGDSKNNAMWAPTVTVTNESISTTIDKGVILNANDEDILELFSDDLENDLAAVQEVIDVEKNADGVPSKAAGYIEDERESDEKNPSDAAIAPDDKGEKKKKKKKMGAMTKGVGRKRSSLVSLADSTQSFELDSNDVLNLLDILDVESPGIVTAAKSQNNSGLCSTSTATTGASTSGTRTHSKTIENDGGCSSEKFSAAEQKLLENVGFLLSSVRQTISTLPTDDSTASLLEFGKTAYSTLTGVDFADTVLYDRGGGASSTDDTVDVVVEILSKTEFDEQDHQKKRRRPVPVHIGRERLQQSAFDSLCESTNLPSQLCFLLSGLLASHGCNSADEGGQTEVYASLDDVEYDLREMLDDPKRHLFDIPPSEQSGKLTFDPLVLYGREIQIEELTDVFERVVLASGSREGIVVSGKAGSGKSVLVDKLLHQYLYPSGGRLIRAKFQQLGQIQPISVVLQAFDEFCQDVLNAGNDDLSARLLRTSIADAVGTDGCRVLSSLMPSMGPMLGIASSPSPESATEGHAAFNRSLYYLRQFIKAIGSSSHPVVLLFDDLQWVDQTCLDLIITLLADDFTSLLFVGCCPEDEVESDPDHPLRGFRLKMLENGVPVSDVVLRDLRGDDLNVWVADLLHSSPRATEQLSRMVYAKTGGGNPLFVKQFILSLYEDRSLTYSPVAGRWVWTMKDIQAREVASNVVGLLTSKICRLDEKSQTLLKVCAGLICMYACSNRTHHISYSFLRV